MFHLTWTTRLEDYRVVVREVGRGRSLKIRLEKAV